MNVRRPAELKGKSGRLSATVGFGGLGNRNEGARDGLTSLLRGRKVKKLRPRLRHIILTLLRTKGNARGTPWREQSHAQACTRAAACARGSQALTSIGRPAIFADTRRWNPRRVYAGYVPRSCSLGNGPFFDNLKGFLHTAYHMSYVSRLCTTGAKVAGLF